MCQCVCVCARACVCACVCARARVRVFEFTSSLSPSAIIVSVCFCVCRCVRACVRADARQCRSVFSEHQAKAALSQVTRRETYRGKRPASLSTQSAPALIL